MDDKTTQEPIEGQAVLPGFEGASQVDEEYHAQDAVEEEREKIGLTAQKLLDYINSNTFAEIRSLVKTIQDMFTQIESRIEEQPEPVKALAPFLLEELASYPDLADTYSWDEVLTLALDADGNPLDGPLKEVAEKAIQRQAKFLAAQSLINEAEQLAEELPRIISNPPENLAYPLDKPNSVIWNLLAEADTNGQIALEIDTTSQKDRRKGKEALIYYAINFDDIGPGLTISKQLKPYDKRVYVAAAALFNAGNSIITVQQIHRGMGNRGRPSKEQIKKINESLTKMGAAHIYLDNKQETGVNKGYTRFEYDGSLLPFERVRAFVNNTLVETAIHLFREPPMVSFAKDRNQVTTIPIKLLETESTLSQTVANLTLEDYLLERISHMKNPKAKAPRKILLSSIYERCHITGKTEKDRKERQRTPDKIRKYLDHYKACGWIYGYRLEKDSVTVYPEPPKKALPK